MAARERSPSSILTPARFRDDSAKGANRLAPRLLLALALEAGEHLRCVLKQYADVKARLERCLREAQLLGAAATAQLDRVYCPNRASRDAAHLLKHATRVLSHPHVGDSLRRLTDVYDEFCQRWIGLEPGEHPGEQHELTVIDEALKAEPLGKLVCRLLLQLPPEPGYPLGRPWRRRSRRYLKERARAQKRKRKA